MKAYLLGYDVGSSSVKANLTDADSGETVSSVAYPAEEMGIVSRQAGWAEQDPQVWWLNLVKATHHVLKESRVSPSAVAAIGISYQMHGLVIVDKHLDVLRPSIIWCDSRAVAVGEEAGRQLEADYQFGNLLNAPGNFTASKLKWVMQHEPEIYERTFKVMLPGDYIAMKMTGEVTTTAPGLSEGIMWDFKQRAVAGRLFTQLGLETKLVADVVPAFSMQGKLNTKAAKELGLQPGTPLCYRAGDQPNNAFSLKALHPGEVAATAGTSGVVYAVVDKPVADRLSRVNTFLHVNDRQDNQRLGVLLCVNGAGIMNSWLRRNLFGADMTYAAMNALAAEIPVGSEQLTVLPFGNGAERMLNHRDLGASLYGLDLIRHTRAHMCRAVQEGIVFALAFGFEMLRTLGIEQNVIRAGNANMFQSEIFCETFAHATRTTLQLFNTDGAQGAARGAGVGSGYYKDMDQAFLNMTCLREYRPVGGIHDEVQMAFGRWKERLKRQLETR